jgi:integrase
MTNVTNSETTRRRRGRRANGEGSASLDRRRGLWYGQYSRADGSRGKTVGFVSEAEALQKARDLEYEERNGIRPREQNHRRTVADVLDAWVETHASQVELSTRVEYEHSANQLRAGLGRISLEELTRLDVQRYANAQRRALRHGTVRKRITVLQMALGAAVEWGWIGRNIAQRLSIKKDEDPIDIDGLTDEESHHLLHVATGRSMEHLLTVGVWTGLRKGELLGLRWQDVGLQRINVRQTLVWRSGQPWTFKSRLKTRAGRRSLPQLPVVAEALQKQNARVAELRGHAGDLWTEYDLVFPNEIGGPIHPANVNHELAKLEKLAGIEHHRVHDWRHTAATKMLTAGVPDRIVMEVCGWSDRTMLDRYQHVSDEHLDEFVELMVERHPGARARQACCNCRCARSSQAGRTRGVKVPGSTRRRRSLELRSIARQLSAGIKKPPREERFCSLRVAY